MLRSKVLSHIKFSRLLSSGQPEGVRQHFVSVDPTGSDSQTDINHRTTTSHHVSSEKFILPAHLSLKGDRSRGLHGISRTWEILRTSVTRRSRQPAQYGVAAAAADPIPSTLAQELSDLLGDRFTDNTAVCQSHGKDESYHDCIPPNAVAFPESTAEVSEIVRACAKYSTPVIPYGTGTSLEGHVAALRGGISLDMSRMNRVLHVNAEDMDCRVEAGVTRKALNEALRDSGLFFSVDPGADASIGGMTATRASGTNTVRYGSMRDVVMGMTAVLADGSIAKIGTRARKSSAGYDLTRLLVGSEGTLAVITEVALRLFPVPEAISAAVCSFASMKGAVDAVVAIMQCGVPVARIELLDELTLQAVNAYSDTDFAIAPTLFFEFHGSPASVAEQAQFVGEIVGDYGGSAFQWHTAQEERTRLWSARHTAYWASIAMRPGCRGYPTDVCVPISHLAPCVLAAQQLCRDNNIIAPLVGHVGDGNFHMMMLVHPEDEGELQRAKHCVREMVKLALDFGGTCTGELPISASSLPSVPGNRSTGMILLTQE
eukprot:jgi/Botrbrau1/8427/Bobra.0237s0046.2